MKHLIIGGAGFIGSNVVSYYLRRKDEVVIYDNFMRPGTEANLAWLEGQGKPIVIRGDIRDNEALSRAFAQHSDVDTVFLLAAQVAVTTSIANPREDFEINALGSFNVLEAIRRYTPEAIIIYSSTNKVYGDMEDTAIVERGGRYHYRDLVSGISETQPLNFHSPYGCSKGSADQYILDYARIYGLSSVVLRQSCIYGYRQFGIEDQGWVAWFTIAATLGKPITIYGDGKQVRDLLFVEDLVDAYQQAIERIDVARGKVYNIGGGPGNQASLLEVLAQLERVIGKPIPLSYDDWRPGDQRVCVMDISKAKAELNWKPKIGISEGIERLARWVAENRRLFDGRVSKASKHFKIA